MAVQYRTMIKGLVKPGKSFSVRGVINPSAYRYGIAFYYNPRFDENVVVCNSWDGQWNEEERPADMPFKEGHPFEVTIYCTGHGYDVYVNGQQVHSFKHRLWQFDEIDVFDICGDLQVFSVEQ